MRLTNTRNKDSARSPSTRLPGRIRTALVIALAAAALAFPPGSIAGERPNILLITADDMNWDSVGAFGCKVDGTTPNLDRLAVEGMRFTNAHVTVAVCAPSRAVMMTGRYPHGIGAEGFGGIRTDVETVPELLAAAGYVCGIVDKVSHLKPVEKYGWARAYGIVETGNGRNPAHYAEFTAEFIARARAEGRPFFLMANSRDPHRPFAGSRQERQYIDSPRNNDERSWANPDALARMASPSRVFRPEEIVVPAFLPDVPDIREEVADYYSSVRRCDDAVGAVLAALERSGEADNTLVIFLSDNGMPFPFAKFSCYLHGTRTPMIVRWPARVEPGSVSESLVGGVDLAPTMLRAAGLPPARHSDGRDFLDLLRGERRANEEPVFTAFYVTALREPVPTRAVHERRYSYIFNRWSDGASQCQDEAYKGLALQAMIRAAREDDGAARRLVHFLYRTTEELYDSEADPDSLVNLVGKPEHAATLQRFRTHLADWMHRTADPLLPDFEAFLSGKLPPMSGPADPK